MGSITRYQLKYWTFRFSAIMSKAYELNFMTSVFYHFYTQSFYCYWNKCKVLVQTYLQKKNWWYLYEPVLSSLFFPLSKRQDLQVFIRIRKKTCFQRQLCLHMLPGKTETGEKHMQQKASQSTSQYVFHNSCNPSSGLAWVILPPKTQLAFKVWFTLDQQASCLSRGISKH